MTANPWRGEAMLEIGGEPHVLRPSFAALVAAEGELGPLLALVERAASGGLALGEIAALFWHCLPPGDARPPRDAVGDAVVAAGLAGIAPALRTILGQVLGGAR